MFWRTIPNSDELVGARNSWQGAPVKLDPTQMGELHRVVGGYPGESHRMPMCCQAMRDELRNGDATVIFETDSGHAPALTMRYNLPRPGTLRA